LASVNVVALDARDLGADQRGAVLEISRAIRRPELELRVAGGQCVDLLLPLVRRRDVAGCGAGQRAVELTFGFFEVGSRCPQQPGCFRTALLDVARLSIRPVADHTSRRKAPRAPRLLRRFSV
jgi:hypothetical protein